MEESAFLSLTHQGKEYQTLKTFSVHDSLLVLKALACETLSLDDLPPYHRLRLSWRSEFLDDYTPWNLETSHPLVVQNVWQSIVVELRSSGLVPLLNALTFLHGRSSGNPIQLLKTLFHELVNLKGTTQAPLLLELVEELYQRRWGPVDGLRLWAQLCDVRDGASVQCLEATLRLTDWAPRLVAHETRFLQFWAEARPSDVCSLMEECPYIAFSTHMLTDRWCKDALVVSKALEEGSLGPFLRFLMNGCQVSRDMVQLAVGLDGETLRYVDREYWSDREILKTAVLNTEHPARLFLDLTRNRELFEDVELQKLALRGTWSEEETKIRHQLAAELLQKSHEARLNPDVLRYVLPLALHLIHLVPEEVQECLPHLLERARRSQFLAAQEPEEAESACCVEYEV